MQKWGFEHETPNNRSSTDPVVVVLNFDHERPLKVISELGLPGTPLAPTAAQKVGTGHETLYVSPAGPIRVADDQMWPLYTAASPDAIATQNLALEHDTESIDPPSAR